MSTTLRVDDHNRPHGTVDDKPSWRPWHDHETRTFFEAVELVEPPRPILLLDPGGTRLDQSKVKELSNLEGFSLLCGRYEGVDERIRTSLVDEQISIGDFVLAGGEFAAMVVVEAVARLVPRVFGNEISPNEESFDDLLLEYSGNGHDHRNFEDLWFPKLFVAEIMLELRSGV